MGELRREVLKERIAGLFMATLTSWRLYFNPLKERVIKTEVQVTRTEAEVGMIKSDLQTIKSDFQTIKQDTSLIKEKVMKLK